MVPVLSQLESSYPGQVRVIFKNRPLNIHPNSMMAHQAALAAARQGKFWQMHDAIFANQRSISRIYILGLAQEIGLDMKTFQSDFNSQLDSIIQADVHEGDQKGVEATPTFFVNGEMVVGARTLEQFQELIDRSLRNQKGTGEVVSKQSGKDASIESPIKGAKNPKVTLEEFADAECPYCGRSVGLLNAVIASHPGDIAVRFRHFPLPGHQGSMLAHVALVAAGKQGKFWEMHDLIFAHQDEITRPDLIHYASEIGLDEKRFVQELNNPQSAAVVNRDRAEGETLGVDATPTFFVNGKKFVGVPDGPVFKRLLEGQMSAMARLPSTNDALVSVGSQLAPAVLVWFSDLEGHLMPDTRKVLEELRERYPTTLRVVMKGCPLQSRNETLAAYEALHAAAARAKGWEMLKLIAENPNAMTLANLAVYAQRLGFNPGEFMELLAQHKFLREVQNEVVECRDAGVEGTPVFFVNTQRIDGLQPLASFVKVIEEEGADSSLRRGFDAAQSADVGAN